MTNFYVVKMVLRHRFYIIGLFFFFTSAVMAQFSANAGITSDYVWRGVSQTDENPTLQGGLDYGWEDLNLYIGAWGSGVDFTEPDANVEIDVYLGFANELENGFSYDLGYMHYAYDESDFDFDELYFGMGFKIFSAKYSFDFENENGYLEGAIDFELPKDFGLGLHAARYDLDLGADYTDYKIGLSKAFFGLDFELAFIDTDLSHKLTDGRVVLSIIKNW